MPDKLLNQKPYPFRPPIVCVLGHVDHGKTTLLDTIRKTHIAEKERGQITQHISAYQITLPPGTRHQAQRTITLIDTPGHEAFAKMRGRGAKVADIAILVVAGNDGVMPQTIEAIAHIKAAKIATLVAINKIDLPGVRVEKIKKQLVKAGLALEEYGGEVPVVPLSAKTGEGIDKLLEMLLLISELKEIRQTGNNLEAVVIESSLSKEKGVTASLILRNGILKRGEEVIGDNQEFRVRALFNWKEESVEVVKAGDPLEVLGWQKLPRVGSLLYARRQVKLLPPLRKERKEERLSYSLTVPPKREVEEEKLKLVVKADTQGSLEAVTGKLAGKLEIILAGVGLITESDVFLAKTTQAIIVGFNIIPSINVKKLAASEKVLIKTYNLIYELFQELEEVEEAVKKGEMANVLGEAKIMATFPIKDQLVAGVEVVSGRIARGDEVKVTREGREIGKARIKSLRHGKEDITRAPQGSQAGLLLSAKIEYLTGDSIISLG